MNSFVYCRPQQFTCSDYIDITGGSQLLSTTSYNVTVKTGDVRGAGTDANCYIKVRLVTRQFHYYSSDELDLKFFLSSDIW